MNENNSYRIVLGFEGNENFPVGYEICGTSETVEDAIAKLDRGIKNKNVKYAYIELVSYTRIKDYVRGQSSAG